MQSFDEKHSASKKKINNYTNIQICYTKHFKTLNPM